MSAQIARSMLRVVCLGLAAFSTVAAVAMYPANAAPAAPATFPGDEGRFVLTWDHTVHGVQTGELGTTGSTAAHLRLIAGCRFECHHRNGDWSPSGQRIVYVNECIDCINRLVTVAPDRSHRRVLLRGDLFSAAWSPDGRRIAFVQGDGSRGRTKWITNVYVIRRDGTQLVKVTHTRRRMEQDVDWSSRGRLVVSADTRATSGDLFSMRPDGTDVRRLTDGNAFDQDPDWAPGGRRLVFDRDGAVWRMDASGARKRRVANGHSPAWSPDSSRIAFVSAADGAIHTVTPSGRHDTLIGTPVDHGSISGLDWQSR